jgi:hypothetical protein
VNRPSLESATWITHQRDIAPDVFSATARHFCYFARAARAAFCSKVYVTVLWVREFCLSH